MTCACITDCFQGADFVTNISVWWPTVAKFRVFSRIIPGSDFCLRLDTSLFFRLSCSPVPKREAGARGRLAYLF